MTLLSYKQSAIVCNKTDLDQVLAFFHDRNLNFFLQSQIYRKEVSRVRSRYEVAWTNRKTIIKAMGKKRKEKKYFC